MPTLEARVQRLLLFLFPSKYKGSIFSLKSKVLSKCIKSPAHKGNMQEHSGPRAHTITHSSRRRSQRASPDILSQVPPQAVPFGFLVG